MGYWCANGGRGSEGLGLEGLSSQTTNRKNKEPACNEVNCRQQVNKIEKVRMHSTCLQLWLLEMPLCMGNPVGCHAG